MGAQTCATTARSRRLMYVAFCHLPKYETKQLHKKGMDTIFFTLPHYFTNIYITNLCDTLFVTKLQTRTILVLTLAGTKMKIWSPQLGHISNQDCQYTNIKIYIVSKQNTSKSFRKRTARRRRWIVRVGSSKTLGFSGQCFTLRWISS